MKSYEERIAAVESARLLSRYAKTEELIEIFLDGDTLYIIDTLQAKGEDDFTAACEMEDWLHEHGVLVPLQPKGTDDE